MTAAAAIVCSNLFHGKGNHHHRKQFRPATSRWPFPTSSRCLTARLSTSPSSSSSSTTTLENKMPMSESHFLKLFNSSCRSGDHNSALTLLESMVSAGYSPGPDRCKELAEGFAANPSNLHEVEHFMHVLHPHGSPDADTYTILITALCHADRITCALALLDSMRCPPKSATYDTLICYFAQRRLFPEAVALLRRMCSSPSSPPTILTYTTLIDASIADGGLPHATDLLDEMSAHGLAPHFHYYNVVLGHMCRRKRVDDAWHLLKHLSSTASPMPNIHTYNVVLRALLDAGRWVDVESVLAEMFSDVKVLPNVSTYNLLIHSLSRAGRVDDAMQVFGLMPCRGCCPNEESYNRIIVAYCNDGRVDHAVALLQRMVAERGGVMDFGTVNRLVASLCKLQMAMEAFSMLQVLQDYCCFQMATTYSIVVGGLWAQGDKAAAVALLGKMLGDGMKPDAVMYRVLFFCLCKDGLVDEAMELAASWMRATRITINALLRGLCHVHMMEAAVEAFLGMFFHMDDVSDAERMLNKPNEKTYEILFMGIARVGCMEEAVELAVKLRSFHAISDEMLCRVKRKVNLLANKRKVNLLANNYNNCSS